MRYTYVAGIIINGSRVLLLKRSKHGDNNQEKWTLVNETIEANEAPEVTVVRGVAEEIGVKFSIIQQLDDHIFDGRTAVFLGSAQGIIRPNPKEVSEIGWFSYKECVDLNLAFGYKKVIENLYKQKMIV